VGCTEKTGKAHFQASSRVAVECQENLGFLFTSWGERCIMYQSHIYQVIELSDRSSGKLWVSI